VHDLASRALLLGIQPERLEHFREHAHMVPGLAEIPFPFLAQVVVHRAFQRGLVDEDAALLVFQRLQQQLVQLLLFHVISVERCRGISLQNRAARFCRHRSRVV
jgi:hypothetical protein